MILEECILTKESNKYWNQLIADRFNILQDSDNMKYLSLKEYITEIPHKFYNNKLYEEYYSLLTSLSQNAPELLSDLFNDEAHKLNIAFETLNEISKQPIHDNKVNISDELEVIRF